MIDWLEIKQFAIAEHVEIEFDDRFTTVTGETGSGKSLIVDAINILVGHRSDNSYIRHEQDSAELQAGFQLQDNHPAHNWLKQNELDNDGECILRRVLRRNKSSKGYINGSAATVSQLKELGNFLIDIHGQNEHHSLLRRSIQLKLLDYAAGNDETVQAISLHYEALTGIAKKINQLRNESHSSQERADMLRFQIDELTELMPLDGEWQELSASHKRLNHQHELSTGAQHVANLLEKGDADGSQTNINDQLLQCINQLDLLSQYAEDLKGVSAMLGEAQVNIQEAAEQLRPFYMDSIVDPEQIQKIESRFSLFHSLARKHRTQPELLVDHLESLKQELVSVADPESEIAALETEHQAGLEKYQKLAATLTRTRKSTSKRLSVEVTEIMQELGLKGGEFAITLHPVEPLEATRYGHESVEFLVTGNPGMPLQPLGKVASGGELSRISLAIQVILANKAQVTTLIFDEVDVGIGGEVANVVGQKLRFLGETSQVICVTHLSQVAARGDQQFSVSKNKGDHLETRVFKLTPEQRVEEIARMTGGDTMTAQSLAHAQEMLKSA
jgi:DNA repair protein RecN (Recombination protein N)